MNSRTADVPVVFGITGDLAKKMTLRALYRIPPDGEPLRALYRIPPD